MAHRISFYNDAGEEYLRYILEQEPTMTDSHHISVSKNALRFGDTKILTLIDDTLTQEEWAPLIADLEEDEPSC